MFAVQIVFALHDRADTGNLTQGLATATVFILTFMHVLQKELLRVTLR